MAISRQKQREGKDLDDEDWTPGEKLRLKGGLSDDGRPAELIREKPNGESLAIDAGKRKMPDDAFGDDAEASMARKRKCDQGKIDWQQCQECLKWFKRPCDLTKHEKTHTRPWKCPEPGCKYHELGWPTEKERDRHINDRHNSAPAMYHCSFEGCSYSSKRESNCKQHMEKTHGYTYVRSKARKGDSISHMTPITKEQQLAQDNANMSEATSPSEGSAFHPMSTPSLTYNPSPFSAPENEFSPSSHDGNMQLGDSSFFPPVMEGAGLSGHNAFLGVGNHMPLPMPPNEEDLYGYPSPSNVGTDITGFSEEDINKTLSFKDSTLLTHPEAPDLMMSDLKPTKDWASLDGSLPAEAWLENFDTSAYPEFPTLMMNNGEDQPLFPDMMFPNGEPQDRKDFDM